MIDKFQFIRMIISRPVHFYLSTLIKIAPVTAMGLAIALKYFIQYIGITLKYFMSLFNTPKQYSTKDVTVKALGVIPVAYITGLTLLGSLGAGYQMRFLLPMIPIVSIVLAHELCSCSSPNALFSPLLLLSMINICHCCYYGILCAPMHADIYISIFEIIAKIIQSPYYAPATREAYEVMQLHNKHYGFHIQ